MLEQLTLPASASVTLAAAPLALVDLPLGARWLVTGNRRVQIQPLDNDGPYRVRVQRLSARGQNHQPGEPNSASTAATVTRVAALRTSLTYFDDFNLPLGAADELLGTTRKTVSTDPRFNLFFVNDQFHAHTLNGTAATTPATSRRPRSASARRCASRPTRAAASCSTWIRPLSPRSVWYLDLNPIPTDLTGHASFFDEEGALGLPAGILRLRRRSRR